MSACILILDYPCTILLWKRIFGCLLFLRVELLISVFIYCRQAMHAEDRCQAGRFIWKELLHLWFRDRPVQLCQGSWVNYSNIC